MECFVDNTVLAAALTSGSCRHRPCQAVIRSTFHIAMTYDVKIAPRWIPSHENVLADALSRFDLTHPIITPSTRAVINSDLSPFAEPFVPPVPSSVSCASSSFS